MTNHSLWNSKMVSENQWNPTMILYVLTFFYMFLPFFDTFWELFWFGRLIWNWRRERNQQICPAQRAPSNPQQTSAILHQSSASQDLRIHMESWRDLTQTVDDDSWYLHTVQQIFGELIFSFLMFLGFFWCEYMWIRLWQRNHYHWPTRRQTSNTQQISG